MGSSFEWQSIHEGSFVTMVYNDKIDVALLIYQNMETNIANFGRLNKERWNKATTSQLLGTIKNPLLILLFKASINTKI